MTREYLCHCVHFSWQDSASVEKRTECNEHLRCVLDSHPAVLGKKVVEICIQNTCVIGQDHSACRFDFRALSGVLIFSAVLSCTAIAGDAVWE